jgi:hypothetical protein
VGVWGVGWGGWAPPPNPQSPIPKSPIPNPHLIKIIKKQHLNLKIIKLIKLNKIISHFNILILYIKNVVLFIKNNIIYKKYLLSVLIIYDHIYKNISN